MNSSTESGKTVKMGCWSGFWGDSALALKQLVALEDINYIIGDFLAEMTMSILVMQKQKSQGKLGYAGDFVHSHMRSVLREVADRRIKIVTNAGGINVEACRLALQALCDKEGVSLKIGVVEGDDLLPRASEFAAVSEMFSNASFPARSSITSINAYLGAEPIVACLAQGCDIVITGRVVDSALALGPLIHEFGWDMHPRTEAGMDLLAAGTLVGHVLECGAQSTGGLFTDCLDLGIESGWWNMGYPVADIKVDGSFVLSKPAGTGGHVSVGTVSEQILYEIGDPGAYIVPDVVCDFRNVSLVDEGGDRVRVSGAKGRGIPHEYKVCATWKDGYKMTGMILVTGIDAGAKAKATLTALIQRIEHVTKHRLSPHQVRMELYGENSDRVIAKITFRTTDISFLRLFAAEFASPATSMAPGTTFLSSGKPKATELVRLFSFLVPKQKVQWRVRVFDAVQGTVSLEEKPVVESHGVSHAVVSSPCITASVACAPKAGVGGCGGMWVPLSWLAWGRSGDKGDNINLVLIARHESLFEVLKRAVLPEHVLHHFTHNVSSSFPPQRCDRFEAVGLHGLNFLLWNCLGGGGMASLLTDALGKGFGQELLMMRVWLSDQDMDIVSRVGFKTKSVVYSVSGDVATITLCNPKQHNAMTSLLVRDLDRIVSILESSSIRAVIIKAEGKSFCAGADLTSVGQYATNPDLNELTAYKFANLFARLNRLPQFVMAIVQGACVGGGMGLVSCCDYVLASAGTRFGLPEVKVGMIPATIYPFVRQRISSDAIFRKMTVLGSEITDLADAKSIGIIDEFVSSANDVDASVAKVLSRVRLSSPSAVKLTKTKLMPFASHLGPGSEESVRVTSRLLADVRVSPHVAEGVTAMKQRQKPKWATSSKM